MPKYYEFKIAGYYLYFTSYCIIECMHVHASDRRLTEAGSAKFFVRDNGDTVLQERGIRHLALTGVCTDICILHTAVDSYNRGYKLTVYQDAVAALTPTGQEWALQHFQTVLGAEVLLGGEPNE